jgi:hypothetical protein
MSLVVAAALRLRPSRSAGETSKRTEECVSPRNARIASAFVSRREERVEREVLDAADFRPGRSRGSRRSPARRPVCPRSLARDRVPVVGAPVETLPFDAYTRARSISTAQSSGKLRRRATRSQATTSAGP